MPGKKKSVIKKSEPKIDVRKIRAELRLTQVEFAMKVGVDPIQISRWEREIAKPSKLARKQLEELCKVEGIKLQ